MPAPDGCYGMSGTAEYRRRAEELVEEGLKRPSLDGGNSTARELLITQVQLELQQVDLKAANAKLEALHQRYHQLFAVAPIAYLVVDDAGVVQESNQRAVQLIGSEPVTGRRLADFLAPESHDVLDLHLRLMLSRPGRSERSAIDLLLEAQAGVCQPVQMHIAALPMGVANGDGEAPGERPATRVSRKALIALIDQTEHKRIEAVLTAARTAAEDLAQTKSSLLATLSHEVRTPMTGVISTLELLNEETLPEPSRELVDLALRSARSLTELLTDILDLSRLEAGRLRLAPIPTTITELAEAAVLPVLGPAAAKQLDLLLDIDPAVPRALLADTLRVRQILGNLLSNAVKFTEHGSVSLEIRRADAGIVCHIRDTGPGIPPERQDRIFTRFEQGETRLVRAHGGSGLGLAIVRQLVQLMGGSVSVISEPDVGSCFTVVLPLGVQPDPHPPTLPIGAWVIVDDRQRQRELLARDLRGLGQRVWDAPSWDDARTILTQITMPAVVVVPDHLLTPAADPLLAAAKVPIRIAALVRTGHQAIHADLADRTVATPIMPSRLRGLVAELFVR